MALLYENETFDIIGLCMEVHKNLGKGFLEFVYKDALEYEFKVHNIPYAREKEYTVKYKGTILPHKFYADFVVFDKIILEVKCVSKIGNEHLAQAINYLRVSNNKVGLVVNFGEGSLQHKRVVFDPY